MGSDPSLKSPDPQEFQEDSWIPPNERYSSDEVFLAGVIPDGYYRVRGHEFRVVTAAYEPEKARQTKSIGWAGENGFESNVSLPDDSISIREPRYFAFIYADQSTFVWPSAQDSTPKGVLDALDELVSAPDPLDFGENFATYSGICWRCGKPLSRETSVVRGVGPVCWMRLGGARKD